jgi:exosortase
MARQQMQEKLDIRTVVLVGRQDFGRCPLAAHLPTALWPIMGRPAVAHLLEHLADAGIAKVVVCCESDLSGELESMCQEGRLEITLLTEDLTSGTAGCLRDAVGSDPGDLIMLLSGSMTSPPALADIIDAHRAGDADLTMVFNPASNGAASQGSPAEIYLCKPDVLRHIPAGGYSDIKEGLIPSILGAGGKVRPLTLPKDVGNFHDRKGYLNAAAVHLANSVGENADHAEVGPGASVHPSARISGLVAVAEGARILEDAVVVGPALIGPQALVGRDSVVVRSAVWQRATVGTRCEVLESIIDCETTVPDRAVVAEQTVSARAGATSGRLAGETYAPQESAMIGGLARHGGGQLRSLADRLPFGARLSTANVIGVLGIAIVLGVFLWSYWPTFVDLRRIWRRSDEYSAGLLVPLLSAYVLWSRRRDIAQVPIRPAIVAGVVTFLLAQAVRGSGLYFMYRSGERLSIVLSVASLVLLMGGWRLLLKLTPILLFLCLMLPWPNRVQAAIALPLQRWATTSAVFCLELIGYEVVQDGNIINIDQTRVAVAEACNGLRMITAFLVISGLVVLLASRAWWEKLLVLISSLPIALLCNTLRLTITAVAFTVLKGERVEKLFHDFGGYAMMPLALGMVVGELWLLAQLTTPPAETAPAVVARRRPRHVPDS